MKMTVPKMKKRLRTREMNSRRTMRKKMRTSSPPRRPGSSRSANPDLRHRLAEDVEQRRQVTVKVTDWAGGQRGLQDSLVPACRVELEQPARVFAAHDVNAIDAVGPALARRRDVHPPANRAFAAERVDGVAGHQVAALDDRHVIADAFDQ